MDNFLLSIEDNPDDILLLGMAFRKARLSARAEFLTDGEKAIEYFSASKPIPLLVLLDLKLPKKSGLEVLAWLRAQPPLRRLPVVMLSSSSQLEDIDLAYDLGANSYLVKPGSIDGLVELAKAIDAFWIKSNALPNMGYAGAPAEAAANATIPRAFSQRAVAESSRAF